MKDVQVVMFTVHWCFLLYPFWHHIGSLEQLNFTNTKHRQVAFSWCSAAWSDSIFTQRIDNLGPFLLRFLFRTEPPPWFCWMFLLGSVGGNLSLLDQPTVASDRCLRLDCNSRDSAWPFSRMHRTKIVLHLCKIAESCRHGRPVLSYLVTSWLVVSHNMIWHDHTYSCEELVTWPD